MAIHLKGDLLYITGPSFLKGKVIAQGTSTNDTAPSGIIGETLTSSTALSSAVSLTTATAADITSLSLTAGDWDVFIQAGFSGGGTTTILKYALSTTTATLPGSDTTAVPTSNQVQGIAPINIAGANYTTLIYCPVSLATTTTVYLVEEATFGAGSCSGFGSIIARRSR